MEIDTLLAFINTNPLCYLVAGIIIGYFLRILVQSGRLTDGSKQKVGRYQSKKVDPTMKRTGLKDLGDLSFDWSDAGVKRTTPFRLSSISPDQQHGNEF